MVLEKTQIYLLFLHVQNLIFGMKNIIGRETEIKQLNEYVYSSKAEFVAIYGRRRVGKTFLVNQLYGKEFSFSVTGILSGTYEEQMTSFVEALKDFGCDVPATPENWMNAFILLKNFLKTKISDGKPLIVFIDELPSFDTQRSGFVRALGYFWNSWASLQDNLTLIVCGSATSWMINHIINDKGGLHNRITHEIHLHPFSLKETELLLQNNEFQWDRKQVLYAYMAMGGIPYYLCMLRKDESFAQNIDRLFFSEDSTLRREYKRLYETLFNSPAIYMEIVRVLATNKTGLSREDIANQLNIASSGNLSAKLEDLINCDIIRKYCVRTKKIKSTSAIYQLVDFFSLFYITFNPKAEKENNYWQNHLGHPELNTWTGLSFEKVCLAHIQSIKRALKIDGIATQHYAWRSKQKEKRTQIDLIIERADRIVNLCEIKFSNEKYALKKEESEKLQNRIAAFRAETELTCPIWLTMITVHGLAPSVYNADVVKELTLDDLFE